MPKPRFEIIKQHILSKIERGDLLPGDSVPSENKLAEAFGVSRMTARRALTDLTQGGILERIQGAGTFVSGEQPTRSLLEIRNIADEIQERGHQHSSKIIALESRQAHITDQHLLGLTIADTYWYSLILHSENEQPIQLEERFVNPALVPDYLNQDFAKTTPSAYLSAITPLSEADHWVEAIAADHTLATILQIADRAPCLKISRRTYTRLSAPTEQDRGQHNHATETGIANRTRNRAGTGKTTDLNNENRHSSTSRDSHTGSLEQPTSDSRSVNQDGVNRDRHTNNKDRHISNAVNQDRHTNTGYNHSEHYGTIKPSTLIVSFAHLYHPGERYRLGGHLNF